MLRGLLLLTAIAGSWCYGEGELVNKEEWRPLNTYGDIWKDCSKPNDHAKIINVSIVPDPPVIGKPINISATLSTDEVITSGKVDIKITYNIFPYTITYNLCDLTKKVNHTCPLQKGKVSVTVPTKIPKEAPKGHYEGKVVVTDQNKQELACVSVKVTLK